jgi:antitoxin VapB
MKIVRSRTFKSGNSEAVRLPKDMAFGVGTEIDIIDNGGTITLRRPNKFTGRDLIAALEALPRPDHVQEREPIEFPERPGL